MRPWKKIKKEYCFNSKWFDVAKHTVGIENGTVINDYYSIENIDAAMIVAVDQDGNVVLKKEYRLPADEILLELPAGGFEESEHNPLEVAKERTS